MPAFIDAPAGEVDAWSFRVLGWVAAPDGAPPVSLDINGRRIVPFLYESAPLAAALPGFGHVRAVVAPVNALDVLRPAAGDTPSPNVHIALAIGDDAVTRDLPVSRELWRSVPEQLQLRARTKAWCLARLRCPMCRDDTSPLTPGPSTIVCSDCGSEIPQRLGAIDMLPPALRQAANLTAGTHVSANPYEELAADLIRRTTAAGGWVLDCGAGSRPSRLPGVVNVEIEDYFSTDVLAVGENLPFRDGVFDAAVSLAVLEHVRDPFACARELLRVVKPGGELVCSVPFLQPVHGYPDHYYNMTRSGLINLFEAGAEVVDCLTPPNGHPIFAMQWILREYLYGLPEPQRSRLGAMTIAQVADLDPARTLPDGIAAQLGDAAMATVACLNTVRLRRRSETAAARKPPATVVRGDDGRRQADPGIRAMCLGELGRWIDRELDYAAALSEYEWHNTTRATTFLLRIQRGHVSILDKRGYTRDQLDADRGPVPWINAAIAYRKFIQQVVMTRRPHIDTTIAIDVGDLGFTSSTAPIFAIQKLLGSSSVLLPHYEFLLNEFHEDCNDHARYSSKSVSACFIGSTTGPEYITAQSVRDRTVQRLRSALFFRNNPRVDFRLTNMVMCTPEAERLLREMGYGRSRADFGEHFAHKFIISMDGVAGTCSRCTLALKSNSVLLKYHSNHVMHYFGHLVPWLHYIPISSDQEVEAILDHEEQEPGFFEHIAQAGTHFFQGYLTREQIADYTSELLGMYVASFMANRPSLELKFASE